MSVAMVLVPLVVALSITVKEGGERKKMKKKPFGGSAEMETIFNDIALLEKTLRERGLLITFVSDNQLICKAGEAQLRYFRQVPGGPLWVTVSGVRDTDKIMTELECFEKEYLENVQSYTYMKLLENLKESNMQLSEETVSEDGSIMLTVNVR